MFKINSKDFVWRTFFFSFSLNNRKKSGNKINNDQVFVIEICIEFILWEFRQQIKSLALAPALALACGHNEFDNCEIKRKSLSKENENEWNGNENAHLNAIYPLGWNAIELK